MSLTLAAALALQVAASAAPTQAGPPPPQADEPGRAGPAVQSEGGADVVVTARRRAEPVQRVPIAISVIGGTALAETGAYNVDRLTQLQPSLQFYSSNPRNSAANIRGLGAPFGLTTTASNRASASMSIKSITAASPPRPLTSPTSSASRSCADRRARSTARTPPR